MSFFAGQIESLSSNKLGRESVIVDKIGYDKYGHTVYTKLGNGTETTYSYDKQRERLQSMLIKSGSDSIMANQYTYDAVDNILSIANSASGKSGLGGKSTHNYTYDMLNRLSSASGSAKDIKYAMSMTFGKMSEPLTKVQTVDSTSVAQSYDLAYKYESAEHPTAPTQIGHEHYTYDANGNPILVENDSTNATREMFWDEDNRLMVLSDNGKTSRYTYNAGGERIIKSHGSMEGVYINGAPQGITFHETDEFTLYPASIITVNRHRFTKHYFIGDKRVASRLGLGEFHNVYGSNGSNVTAGQQDYAERMNQIEQKREEYYKLAGVAPGLPTMKGSYADPEVTGKGYNILIDSLGDHSVPENWVQRPVVNTEAGSNPGAPLAWGSPENPDDAVAGYGYVPCDTSEVEETFYYHSDHLGSTAYITDQQANVTQYDAYLPYGELLVDEHSSSADLPYKFNGKELDEETGLYYYGARYMNPLTSMWYGVDPLTEQYVNIGAYIYCHGNPIILFDPDGQGDYFAKNGQYLGRDKWDDNKVFLADGIVNGHFHNIKRLDVSQHRFKVMANIIAQEGSSKDPEEYTFIANIARNEANAQGRSMWSLLTSGYSSVPDTKTELSNKDNSQKANMARAALIGVVLGNPDPTNGSRFWDGSDFLAWGTGPYKDPKGIERVAHPKFRQYKSIIIPKEIFEKYCAAHKSATIKYYGERYNIPEAVFLNKNNWKNGYFEYSYPKSKGTRTLVATATRGKTIYWKLK